MQGRSGADHHFFRFAQPMSARPPQLGAGYFRKPPSYEDFLKLGQVLRQRLKDSGLI